MENDFFEDRLKNASQLKKFKWSKSIALISAIIVIICTALVGEEIVSWAYYVGFVGLLVLVEIITTQERKSLNKYSGDNKLNALKLYDTSENLQDVYDYINNAMANNQVLFRHRAFPESYKMQFMRMKKDNNIETILLPKYMLDCTCWEVVAIPIDKVRVDVAKDYFNFEMFYLDRMNYEKLKTQLRVENPTKNFWCVSIYYDEQKAIGITERNKAECEKLVEEIKLCLPKKLPENVEDINCV